jgi:hypothetical protein
MIMGIHGSLRLQAQQYLVYGGGAEELMLKLSHDAVYFT